jgi:hypothetical protein
MSHQCLLHDNTDGSLAGAAESGILKTTSHQQNQAGEDSISCDNSGGRPGLLPQSLRNIRTKNNNNRISLSPDSG